jgi:hypothetical protein
MPLVASNSLAKTSNLSLLANWTKIFCMCTLTNPQNSLAITHCVIYDPHSTPRVHNVFLVLNFCNDIATLLSSVFLYACMLLCKNGLNFFTKESKCNTRDQCLLFEHLFDRRTWQQCIYKIRLHLECSLDAFFYIHSVKINVQNQCILLFSLEIQCSHIKHVLYHHVQTWIHNITTRILFFLLSMMILLVKM